MSLIQRLSNKAFEDKDLKALIHKLEENYCNSFFSSKYKTLLTEHEINKLLRFSDILCRSKNTQHRNLSLKIISLLLELDDIKKSEYFQIIATNTLVKLGNFPSIPIIEHSKDFLKIDEISNDYLIKNTVQSSPLGYPFTDAQFKVFEELKFSNHYSFSGSTSFGKSFIFEAFTKYIIESRNKSDNIAFIVPTKALINQVGAQMKKIVNEFEEYKVITSPKIPKVLFNVFQKYIFVFTPERLISYLMDSNNPKIDYLFVDEAHKLLSFQDTRTPLLYHSLVLAKRKSINIFFASPNIPNTDVFLELINNSTEESISIKESPVSQNRFFIDTKSDYSFMISDFGNDIILPKFSFGERLVDNLKKVLLTFSKDRQSIIYCNTRDKTLITAIQLAASLEAIKSDEIDQTIELINDKVHDKYFLKQCLKKGVAYHFGGMPEEIKIRIEKLFKQGFIRFLFCTSTLLEGVNLPAKNIFILSEKIGRKKMSDIDFWNLAGRAGRLRKDLSGNIFCVNLFNQKGYWKNATTDRKYLEIFRNKDIKEAEPQIISKKNDNLYKNINNYFEKKEYTNKKMANEKRKIIEMYGNILLYHDSINNDSVLKDKYKSSVDDSTSLLKKMKSSIKVSPEILAKSIDIDIEYQNKIIKTDSPALPSSTKYVDCLEVLNILYNQYKWEETESKGNNPMIRSKSQLNYYAVLMESWINSKPLKIIIQNALNYYNNNGNAKNIYVRYDGKLTPIKFDKEKDYHINIVINNVVRDLENIIQFKIKKYISNYQALIIQKNQIQNVDWESFIEYGTTDDLVIEIQNLGFPRNIAIFLKNKYFEFIKRDENGNLNEIDINALLNVMDKRQYKNEFEELSELFNLELNE